MSSNRLSPEVSMTDFSDSEFRARVEQRRREAEGVLGKGFPEHVHTIPKTREEAKLSIEALWELSRFVYGVPCTIAMDKSVGMKEFRMGREEDPPPSS